jgi:ABC-type Fe3+ transport system permease subunit
MNRFRGLVGAVAGTAGAVLASLCCLLPLTVVVLGLGSGAFMATTMAYRWLLIPAGVLGVGLGFVLYARERRRCDALGCHVTGARLTLALLIAASLIVATAIVLDQFPEMTSELLTRAMSGAEAGRHSSHQ